MTRAETIRFDDTTTDRLADAGLCRNCVHRSSCLFLDAAVEPVLHCEELATDTVHRTRSTIHAVTDADPSPRRAGLCATCVHADACIFPTIKGGVWQCEEYA